MTRTSFAGKRVVILGLARQGTALARFFLAEGAQVTISDVAPADQLSAPLTELAGQPVRLVLGGHPPELIQYCDLLCLSGGVPPQIPLVAAARRQGILVSNDALLTLQHSPAPAIGITGSSGKTTTTTLVGLMLNDGAVTNTSHAWVGGNIGLPLIDKLAQVQPADWLALELSSFQLELFDGASYGPAISPQVAAILNITPNHLDRHPSMAHYSAAKANILRWQNARRETSDVKRDARSGDIAVLSADDPVTGDWLRRGRVEIAAGAGQETLSFPIAGRRLGFGLGQPAGDGCWLGDDGWLTLHLDGRAQPVLPASALKLRGRHNLLNVAAACAISAAAGARPEAMAAAAGSFTGVEHRLELVAERAGVRWYNDSIATAPERAAAALRSFTEPVVLLAGGRDKKLPWQDFARLAHQRARVLILFGEAASLIAEAIASQPGDELLVLRCADLPDAVAAAQRVAQPGEVVLLSPGGASYDAYKDFAARGEHFRTLVNEQ